MFKRLAIGMVFGAAIMGGCQSEAQTPVQQVSGKASKLFEGQWINDRNSGVTFIETNGLLSGYYQTALGQPEKSKRFPLTGFVEGDQITFTVNFKGYGSMTSWIGQMTKDEQGVYIRTLWNLTRDVDDAEEDEDMWNSITSGASDFRRAEDVN